MIKIPLFVVLACLTFSLAFAADWKSAADLAIEMTPGARSALETKNEKSEQDIHALTIIYYREFQRDKLKKLFAEQEKIYPDSPALRLLQGIILMWDHQRIESRRVLADVIQSHPHFYPAQITLAHLDYLQKDFESSYRMALRIMAKQSEISRFHYVLSLLLASGAKGIITSQNLIGAIPAYFEVNGYLKKAQKLMPKAPEVLFAVGAYHLLTPAIVGGDLEIAIALLEKSRQMTPLNPAVYVRLAQAYRVKGQTLIAKQYLLRAQAIDPQDELLLDDLSGKKVYLDVP